MNLFWKLMKNGFAILSGIGIIKIKYKEVIFKRIFSLLAGWLGPPFQRSFLGFIYWFYVIF